MLANVKQAENGYVARFERHWEHSVEKVWSYLTQNDKLAKWFAELQVMDLCVGGIIKFDMQDDTFEEMKIVDLHLHSVLEYTWGEDQVRFELYPENHGCRLLLIEKINNMTSHTPRDLAGWHVCLDVIQSLLDEHPMESREHEWEKRYKEYAELIHNLQ